MLKNIDENTLNFEERLGLAYCRLNSYEWDDILGDKPEGFDDLPSYVHRGMCKHLLVRPAIQAIKEIIGEAQASRYHWRFVLGKTDEEWFRYYVTREPF